MGHATKKRDVSLNVKIIDKKLYNEGLMLSL